ncbi:hypothetical protein [Aquimarina algiphila]|uniref:TapB family protein n=1 Tax=Aquimarina algiphila TaxID=2047982 RepID=UPI00248FD79F|nr:hypothetical protein [Aquimarina algiphila]
MKIKIGILITILVSLFCIRSYAQNCDEVLFMKKGAILTYTDYNKKGKELNSTVHETTSVTQENNLYTAIIQATRKDQKNKETFTTSFKTRCEGGLFSVDMMRFFNYDKLSEQQQKGLKLKIDGDVLEFPVNSKVGDQMDDGHITIKLNSEGFTLITMTFDIKNRKIVGEESITTPAGTFDCQKVTFDFESKFGIIKVKGSGIEWYHDNVVVIKSESYNKKGKLTGYHQLTKVQ